MKRLSLTSRRRTVVLIRHPVLLAILLLLVEVVLHVLVALIALEDCWKFLELMTVVKMMMMESAMLAVNLHVVV